MFFGGSRKLRRRASHHFKIQFNLKFKYSPSPASQVLAADCPGPAGRQDDPRPGPLARGQSPLTRGESGTAMPGRGSESELFGRLPGRRLPTRSLEGSPGG